MSLLLLYLLAIPTGNGNCQIPLSFTETDMSTVGSMKVDAVKEVDYYFHTVVSTDFDTTVANIREALPPLGFGILTEIDFSGKMKEKLDKDINRCLILGACNPPFGYEAYVRDQWIGVELPCNVVVREMDNGSVEVAMKNPALVVEFTGNEELRPMSEEIKQKVRTFLNGIASSN